ncbi:MAG: extracellular solute-binding protein [Pseudomonadota bacterium]
MSPRNVALLGAIAVALTLSAPPPSLSQSGEPLSVLSGLDRENTEELLQAYQASTGETFEYEVQAGPTEDLIAHLRIELASGSSDVGLLIMAIPQLQLLDSQFDLFEPLESVSPDAILDTLSFDGIAETVPFGLAVYTLMYNTDKIAEGDKPTSFADLLDEKFDNQVGLASPMTSANVWNVFWFLTEEMEGEPYGWPFFEALQERQPTYTSGHGALRDLVISGERGIGIQTTDNIAAPMDRGESVSYSFPSEGVPTSVWGAGVPAAGDNAELAERIVAWLLSDDGQDWVVNGANLVPVSAGSDYTFKEGTRLADLELKLTDVDYVERERANVIRQFQALSR